MGHKGDTAGYFGPAISAAFGFLGTLAVLLLLIIINYFLKTAILQKIIDLFYANLLLLLAISLALGYGSTMAGTRALAPLAPLVSALGATLIVILIVSILDTVIPSGFSTFTTLLSENIIVVFGVLAAAGYAGFLMQTVRE